jgi:hypothetical protein
MEKPAGVATLESRLLGAEWGGGRRRVDAWILGSQPKWFRQVSPQKSVCPLLDLTPYPIIWRKSGRGII